MSRPNTTLPSGVRHSVQNIWNWGFDDDFGLPMVETLVYNPVTDAMERSVTLANTTATGIIDALNETVECVVSPGASTVGCQLTGNWAAVGDLITFEGTVDGTNWTSIYANLTSVGSLAVTVSGSNGIYQMAAAGMVRVRVRGSTWGTPGSCSVSFNSTVGSSASLLALPLPVGSNLIGKVDVDGQRYYEYMGKKTAGDYTYYGFKERNSVEWKVMRKDNTDDAAWQYAYSESSANAWTTAWATPGDESYGDPPDT